ARSFAFASSTVMRPSAGMIFSSHCGVVGGSEPGRVVVVAGLGVLVPGVWVLLPGAEGLGGGFVPAGPSDGVAVGLDGGGDGFVPAEAHAMPARRPTVRTAAGIAAIVA